LLATKDAQGLYQQFGFQEVKTSDSFAFMEIFTPNVYQR